MPWSHSSQFPQISWPTCWTDFYPRGQHCPLRAVISECDPGARGKASVALRTQEKHKELGLTPMDRVRNSGWEWQVTLSQTLWWVGSGGKGLLVCPSWRFPDPREFKESYILILRRQKAILHSIRETWSECRISRILNTLLRDRKNRGRILSFP